MNTNVSFQKALYNCALECALQRDARKCRKSFRSSACDHCKWYIGKYINAVPEHIELYMIQAEMEAGAIKATSSGHHMVFGLLTAICLFLAFICYRDDVLYKSVPAPQVVEHIIRATDTKTASSAPAQVRPAGTIQKVSVSSVNSGSQHEVIQATLRKVTKDLKRKVDVNRDGLVNYIDSAVLFYKYYLMYVR